MIAHDLSIAAQARRRAAPAPWFTGLTLGGTPAALALDFTRNAYAAQGQDQGLNSLFALTRSDPKTAHSNTGQITLAAANTPALDHDPMSAAPRGLRLDPTATNLLTQSKTPHLWTQPVGTGSSAAAVSDFGAAEGAGAVAQTATATRPYLEQGQSVSAGTVYCFSVLVEDVTGGASWDQIARVAGLSALAPTYRARGQSVAPTDPAQPGLLEITVTPQQSGTLIGQMGLGVAGPASGTLRLSRPQLEAGAARSAFIPTGATSAGRTKDLMAATNTGWLTPVQGTIQTKVTLSEARNNYPVLWSLEAGGDTLRLLLRKSNNRLVLQAKRGGSYLQTERDSPGFGLPFTVAATWEADRLALSVAGGSPAEWSGSLTHPAFSSVTLGNAANGSLPMSLWMENLTYWPVAASAAQLQTLSA